MQAHYNFEVTPTIRNGKVSWELCFLGPANPPNQVGCGTKANVYVPVGHASQTFKYTINDNTGLDLSFAPKPPPAGNDGPIWIQFGAKPTAAVKSDEISIPVGAGQKELNFIDRNDKAGVLKYQLNFIDKDGNKSALDPDITNGGKGFWAIGDPTTLMIGAAVAAALLFVWLSQVRRSGRNNAKLGPGADSNQVG